LKVLLPLLFAAVLFLIWQILSSHDIINSALFPSPAEIVKTIPSTNHLIGHMFHSLYRLAISVAVGSVLGFCFGLLIGLRNAASFLEDVIAFFMSIPGISWAPLFIILIGFGDKTILAVGALTAFFPVVYNVYHGLKELDKNLVNLGRVFEYSPFQSIIRIKLPSIMNYLVTALKLAFARTWRTIIAVEMIAATMFGLGYMLFDARELLNMETMFVGILFSGILYVVIEILFIRLLETITVERWGMKRRI
jgi:NitT/TauT family transport system permease protein